MASSSDIVAKIKSLVPLSLVVRDAVELKGPGPSFVALCPFHQEKTPSFNVWDKQGAFKCFGCGAYGDVFEFIMRLRGLAFGEALAELSERAGLKSQSSQGFAKTIEATKKDPLIHAQNVAQEFFIQALQASGAGPAKKYLEQERGLHAEMIRQAGLGFGGNSCEEFVDFLKKKGVSIEHALEAGLLKPGSFTNQATFLGRITFPIKSFLGQIIAFGGRSFLPADLSAPKYVNTHAYIYYEKRRAFYGLFESRPAILKGRGPVVVEGYFDALAIWAAGSPAIALCGTALSIEHVKILKRLCSSIVLCFDSDGAGTKALRTSLTMLLQNDFKVGVAELKKNDPGEYQSSGEIADLKKIIGAPADALVSLIDQASLAAQNSFGSRITEIEQLMPVLASIQKPIIRRQYVAHLAKGLNEDPSILWKEIESLAKKKMPKEKIQPDKLRVQMNSREKIILQALRVYPKLVSEITQEILGELTPPLRDLVDGFIANGGESSLGSYLEARDQALAQAIISETHSEIPFKFEELQEILRAIHRQTKKNDTKKTLQGKRLELLRAQKENDFGSILKTLAEQSSILAKSKPPLAKPVKLAEMLPKIIPQPIVAEPNNHINDMGEDLEMLPEEDDWV